MVEILAELLQQEPEWLDDKIDLDYRVRFSYAQRRNLSRDVIIQFLTKKMKEVILCEQFQNLFKVQFTKIIVMKELPRKMVQERKGFKKLTDKLRKQKIRFHW